MGDTYYNPDKLYSKLFINTIMRKAPYELKLMANRLPEYDCVDKNGNLNICVKIPEVIFVYIKGKY